ncbi:MAG TPA: M20/M25/M40 family metallo-hydrolase [Thermodesulfobacteriota bacterium]|nr:M20/M25/M40 family metallo-hydrolase [Thermodesulfobacteriota bacterium]
MIEKQRINKYVMDLIKIDSLSRKEKEVGLKLKKDMEELGAECFFDNADEKVGGNIGNLIVKIKGNKTSAPPFLLSAHMDTVGPGEGIRPRIEDGVIKSDGTTILGSDDKSGLAVIVEVVRTLKEKDLPHGDIEIAFTVCEEIGLLGAKHIDESNFRSKYGMVLDTSSPSLLVIKCPSAEKLEFKVYGLEAHAGICPERGISAIKVASDAISKMNLGRVDFETTANIGIIKGGHATNVIPNCVHIHGETRSHDEEKLRSQVEHMRKCFHEAASLYELDLDGKVHRARVEEHIERSYYKMDVPTEAKVVKFINQAVKNLGYDIKFHASGGGCDANYFNRKGIECVNLGTGMKDIHTVNEYLILEEFHRTADIVLETIQLNAVNK